MTSHNPQANSVCKRLYQTIANTLRATTNGTTNAMQQATCAVDDGWQQPCMQPDALSLERWG
eukprot:5579199-Ditylum_brightwellii.AAC.1